MNIPSSSNSKYDDVDWHVGGEFPDDLDAAAGRTHIGMYLAWLIEQRLMSESFEAENANLIEQCRDHMVTGSQVLESCCDDVLISEDMSDIGQAFTDFYYEDLYLDDYVDTLDDESYPSIYHVPDDWDTYAAMRAVLQDRFDRWRNEQGLD